MEIAINGTVCDTVILSYRVGQSELTAEYMQSNTSLYAFSSAVGVRPLTMKALFREGSRGACEIAASNFMRQLRGKNEIAIIGGNQYTAVLLSAKDLIPIGITAMTAEYEFAAVAHGDEIVRTIANGDTVECGSTVPETDCVLTVTSAANVASASVMGVTIQNLAADVPVIVDGRSKLVTAETANKFADTDLVSFPTLRPGANPITISGAVTVQLAYYPTYL